MTPVPGAQGTFTPAGTMPLISDDENYPSVNGLGLADLAGRVDSFTYDEVNQRLFAAPGTGGVYVTEDLGALWTSVGDALPYQSVVHELGDPLAAARAGRRRGVGPGLREPDVHVPEGGAGPLEAAYGGEGPVRVGPVGEPARVLPAALGHPSAGSPSPSE
jgi:hypothetical protein